MNENWLNNKFNIIKTIDFEEDWNLPDNFKIHNNTLAKAAFNIRQGELDNDEAFSGNFILNKSVDKSWIERVSKLPLDDNSIYVNNFVNSPHADKCSIDDSIIYCGTFVLWMLSNFDRTQYPIYSNLRRHRIVLKRFGDYV
jgi:hypothetical protein